MPVPLSGIVCGLLGAASVRVRVAFSAANSVGVNVTEIVQLDCGESVLEQVLVWLKSALLVPLNSMPGAGRSRLPVLVSVTIWGLLVEPTSWVPKFTLAGETPALGLGTNLLI